MKDTRIMATEDVYIRPTETLQRIRAGEGDGFPGPDFCTNIAGQWMAEMLAPRVREVVEELKARPTGFDFDNIGDVFYFREAVISGLQIVLEQTADELMPQEY